MPGKFGFDSDHVDFELFRRAHGVPFLLGDDGEEILDPNHARAGNVLDRAFIDSGRNGAGDFWPNHARVQHARQPHVGGHFQRAEDFAGQIATQRRCADDLKVLRLLDLGLPVHGEREAELPIPLDGRVEISAADQLCIGDVLVCVGGILDDAVFDGKPLRRDAELAGSHADHQAAGFRRHPAQIHAGAGNAGCCAGAAHVDGAGSVAHDELHAVQRNVEFFGDHLRNRGAEPLAAVDLAVIGDDRAVLLDGDIGIELIGRQPAQRRRFLVCNRNVGPIG